MLKWARYIIAAGLLWCSQTAAAQYCPGYAAIRLYSPTPPPKALKVGQQIRFALYAQNQNSDCTVEGMNALFTLPDGSVAEWYNLTLGPNVSIPWYRTYTVRAQDIKLPSGKIEAVGRAVMPAGQTYAYGFSYWVRGPDVNLDGTVDLLDLVQVIQNYGGPASINDVNASGRVEIDDIAAIILAWGQSG